ncbi:MAG: ATP-binding protein [Pseudonocardia sediminis]
MTATVPRTGALADLLPRPLDPIRSIKVKLSLLLLVSGGVGVGYLWNAYRWVPPASITIVTVGIVLVTAQVLAHGMTRPLREMTSAAQEMARGDYSRRVRATSRDEVGRLAEAFNRMAADLETADRQRRELVANVSHELRTPITALRAVLENVVDGVAEPDPATLHTALAQTERLGRLVDELLDLSRIDAGAVALQVEELAVRPLLDSAVAETAVAAQATGRRVGFRVEVEPPELTATADRARLHQVLVNLLDNAARHAPPYTDVHLHAHTSEGELMIEVTDHGDGIADADRDAVFHRFTRGERARGGGTGLGLSIARWAVELHGGRIAVVGSETDAGAAPGCRIRVTLPLPVRGEVRS